MLLQSSNDQDDVRLSRASAPSQDTVALTSAPPRDSPVWLHGPNAVEQRLLQQPEVDAGVHGTVEHLQLVDVDVRKPLCVAAQGRLAHGQNLFPLCY